MIQHTDDQHKNVYGLTQIQQQTTILFSMWSSVPISLTTSSNKETFLRLSSNSEEDASGLLENIEVFSLCCMYSNKGINQNVPGSVNKFYISCNIIQEDHNKPLTVVELWLSVV